MDKRHNIEYFISEAKIIIEKHQLEKYINILFDYWASEPPTLGHGFGHVIKVAVNSYLLGVENDYPNPEELFIGGLYHDIFRPARGQDGEEDQTGGAKITAKLFKENNVDQKLTEKVLAMINSHDNWRTQDNPPLFDLFISLGDKWAHDPHCFYTYMWASNKYLQSQGKLPEFDSHLRVFTFFVKYQQRAWEIFYKYRRLVKGMDKPISSYLGTYEEFTKEYRENGDFIKRLDNYAREYKGMEEKMLHAFFNDQNKINKILIDGISLI